MHEGQVRAILGRHALARSPDAAARLARGPAMPDPNALAPATDLRAELDQLDPEAQRRLAADYVALWARTFRTLVTHLRGRPERALALFADEVYPFLRGDRLAARVDAHSISAHRARLTLAGGLPEAYLCGLVEAFVGLSGATVACRPVAPGQLDVTYQVAPVDRAARLVQHFARLRLGLVTAALLAAATGIALAASLASVPVLRTTIVLVGVAAAQLAANALHALRHAHPAGPLAALRPSRNPLRVQLGSASTIAIAAAGFLAVTGTPLVLLFAAAGAAAGLLYAPLRDRGLGPLVTALLYGPLIAEGALHAFDASSQHLVHVAFLPWTLVPGALAAAALYVDDLAEAPLDEAGGKRTLAVRLPRGRQAAAYAVLVATAFVPLLVLALRPWNPQPLPLAIAAVALLGCLAAALALRVRSNLDNPRRLAPARIGTQALHAAATALLLALAAGGLP